MLLVKALGNYIASVEDMTQTSPRKKGDEIQFVLK